MEFLGRKIFYKKEKIFFKRGKNNFLREEKVIF